MMLLSRILPSQMHDVDSMLDHGDQILLPSQPVSNLDGSLSYKKRKLLEKKKMHKSKLIYH